MVDDTGRLGKNRNLVAKLGGFGNARTLCTHGQFYEYWTDNIQPCCAGLCVFFREDLQRSGTRNQAKNM